MRSPDWAMFVHSDFNFISVHSVIQGGCSRWWPIQKARCKRLISSSANIPRYAGRQGNWCDGTSINSLIWWCALKTETLVCEVRSQSKHAGSNNAIMQNARQTSDYTFCVYTRFPLWDHLERCHHNRSEAKDNGAEVGAMQMWIDTSLIKICRLFCAYIFFFPLVKPLHI